ncbi:MAG: class I SAM-dependent methyltransferase [Candidatus Thorarchaeota archaeon]|nr:class I SAM-dependent methyltransferase [Candidatus Thorarchaeota archaeon]
MYDRMMKARATLQQIGEIADFLTSVIDSGRLLDVGTGPGRLLQEIHGRNPSISLYGLDISESMIRLAERNLNGIDVSLHVSSIQKSAFEDDFFSLVTCTGSFYLWNDPEKGLNEIYRILKPGKTAFLFETHSDYDRVALREQVKKNLQGESFFRRILMPRFLGRQLKMAYSQQETREILLKSDFAGHFDIFNATLASLPIWLRIELYKP